MKTLEEFYKEIVTSKELREELEKTSNEALDTFLKKHGCNADAKEFIAYLSAQPEGEIGDDVVESLSGGLYSFPVVKPNPNVPL